MIAYGDGADVHNVLNQMITAGTDAHILSCHRVVFVSTKDTRHYYKAFTK